MTTRRTFMQSSAASAAMFASGAWPARADNAPGVTDTEIKIGQTMPYSGPASAYGAIGKTEAAYFKMINEQGGVNGRKINLISLDDGYSPPKTVEQTRRLVEQEGVAFIFSAWGRAPMRRCANISTRTRSRSSSIATGAAMFGDHQHFPWTIGLSAHLSAEAQIFGKHILATKPGAKVGVLYQNDGFGKDYLAGLKEGLGPDHAGMIVKEVSYEVSEPTVDSQIVTLQGAGADTLLIAATPKFAAQAIRKIYDLGWSPVRYLTNVSASITSVIKPAGFDAAKGVMTGYYMKDSTDARWNDDPGMKQVKDFVGKYMSPSDLNNSNTLIGYGVSVTLMQVLKQCGNDLSRDNIMKQAANIKNMENSVLLPGIKIKTSPDNYFPIRQMQMASFNGSSWALFGELISA